MEEKGVGCRGKKESYKTSFIVEEVCKNRDTSGKERNDVLITKESRNGSRLPPYYDFSHAKYCDKIALLSYTECTKKSKNVSDRSLPT